MESKIKQLLTKQYKILGRNKKTRIITDLILLILIAIFLIWYLDYSIEKLNIKPIILNAISKTKEVQNIKQPEIKEIQCSVPTISSSAYYYNSFGDQIGVGPNPPIVGIPTNYWVFFEIKNKEANINNVVLSSTLADNVRLTGNKNIRNGKFYFLATNRQIIWEIGNISKNENNKIGFEVSLVPTKEDVSKILPIIKNTNLIAIDLNCNKEVSTTIQNLDTTLKYDKFGKSSGIVKNVDTQF